METESCLRMASNWSLPFAYTAITHLIPSVLFVQIESDSRNNSVFEVEDGHKYTTGKKVTVCAGHAKAIGQKRHDGEAVVFRSKSWGKKVIFCPDRTEHFGLQSVPAIIRFCFALLCQGFF